MFRDRAEAGRQLAPLVADLALDVLVVRKLGYPPQPELALGAIGEGGVRVLNAGLVGRLGVADRVIDELAAREQVELDRRLALYRSGNQGVDVAGRAVVVVDGLATGATARAALDVVRAGGADRVVLAVPVAPPGVVRALRAETAEVVCVEVSERFVGIGQWYDDFHQVVDDEVQRLLQGSLS